MKVTVYHILLFLLIILICIAGTSVLMKINTKQPQHKDQAQTTTSGGRVEIQIVYPDNQTQTNNSGHTINDI